MPELTSPTQKFGGPVHLGLNDAFCLISAALLTASYLPGFAEPSFVPRFAVMLCAAVLAIVLIPRHALARDRSTLVLAMALLWAGLATVLSSNPRMAAIGGIGRWSSLVVLVGVSGLWSAGRLMSPDGRRYLAPVVLSACGVSALFALLQLIVKPDHSMALEQGRPVGLAGNPIYFGAQMAGCAAFFAYRSTRRPDILSIVGFGVFAFCAALSGSRIALLASVLAGLAPLVRQRSRMLALLVPVALVAAAAAGVVHSTIGSGQSAAERIGTSGVRDRYELWQIGFRAWLDRPLIGWGPGRFRSATEGHYSTFWSTRFQDDRSGAWLDAHNFVVEFLVTVGIVGLALIAYFFVLGIRGAKGPYAWMASSIALTWGLEPAALPTFGLALLLLGAATPTGPRLGLERDEVSLRWKHLIVAGGVVGVLVGSWYLANMRYVEQRLEGSVDSSPLPGWAWWARNDPLVPSSLASQITVRTDTDPGVAGLVVAWEESAVRLEPDFPYWGSNLALTYLALDELDEARASTEASLSVQPRHARSLEVLQIIAVRQRDRELFDTTTRELCVIESPGCTTPWPDSDDFNRG